ncbi:MAG TPA: hypothetical protein VJ725_22635, partial [Thermoanaerobaculia bacterium]|nr:hypothetical protein [Thermoanaerobaculia bacterium]
GFESRLRHQASRGNLHPMRLTVELDRETDGRWIADVTELPGVMVYAATRHEALAAAQALALRVLAEIGPVMLARISRKTGLRPEDL